MAKVVKVIKISIYLKSFGSGIISSISNTDGIIEINEYQY